MKIKNSIVMGISALAFYGCSKEEIPEPGINPFMPAEEQPICVTHHYTYHAESYTLTYYFNSENEVLRREGDVSIHDGIMKSKSDETKIFKVDKISEDGKTFDITLVDSEEELDRLYENTATQVSEYDRCTDWLSQPGNAAFYFFRDINYSWEYTDIRVVNASYFQDQWLDDADNNISSIWFSSYPSSVYPLRLDVFTGSCFSGGIYSLTASVPNLHWLSVDLGDKISSMKGWPI